MWSHLQKQPLSYYSKTTNTLINLASEITNEPSSREYDALVSTGENVSASLLAMSFQALNVDTGEINCIHSEEVNGIVSSRKSSWAYVEKISSN